MFEKMEGRTYFLVNLLLLGANYLITTAYQCESPLFMECSCQSGEREGILLMCNSFPAVKMYDEEALNVIHLFIKGKLGNKVSYLANLWPRLETLQNLDKILYCQKNECVNSKEREIESSTLEYLGNNTEKFMTIDKTEQMYAVTTPPEQDEGKSMSSVSTQRDRKERTTLTFLTIVSTQEMPTVPISTEQISTVPSLAIAKTEGLMSSVSNLPYAKTEGLMSSVSNLPVTEKSGKLITSAVTEELLTIMEEFPTELAPVELTQRGKDNKSVHILIICLSLSIFCNVCLAIALFIIKLKSTSSCREADIPNEIEMENI